MSEDEQEAGLVELDAEAGALPDAAGDGRRRWLPHLVTALLSGAACATLAVLVTLAVVDDRPRGDDSRASQKQRRSASPARDDASSDPPPTFTPTVTKLAPVMVSVPGWHATPIEQTPSIVVTKGEYFAVVNGGTFEGSVPDSGPDIEALLSEAVASSQDADRTLGITHWNDIAYSLLDDPARPIASLDFRMEAAGTRYVGSYVLEVDEATNRWIFIAYVEPGRRRTKAMDDRMFQTTYDISDRMFSPAIDDDRFVPAPGQVAPRSWPADAA